MSNKSKLLVSFLRNTVLQQDTAHTYVLPPGSINPSLRKSTRLSGGRHGVKGLLCFRLEVTYFIVIFGCMTGWEHVKGAKCSFLELHQDSRVNTQLSMLRISYPRLQAGAEEMGKASAEVKAAYTNGRVPFHPRFWDTRGRVLARWEQGKAGGPGVAATPRLWAARKGVSRAGCSGRLASPQAARAAFPGPRAQGQGWEGRH
ncbi:uncharacterized protein LOC129195526 isoform X2 [Grus americana]|uniref:uncharacterized protein LOC129195526 isoform X2 n=1 Tax=Grus americana TaxID=9117 RepID=UPI002407C6B0|nr:uncharacterized protein LOC129195526 isoform X2 [Grus americana]